MLLPKELEHCLSTQSGQRKKDSPQRTLHRDLLLPSVYLSAPEIPIPTQIRKPITRSNTEHLKNHIDTDEDENPIY